jgi:hypothetical protein
MDTDEGLRDLRNAGGERIAGETGSARYYAGGDGAARHPYHLIPEAVVIGIHP